MRVSIKSQEEMEASNLKRIRRHTLIFRQFLELERKRERLPKRQNFPQSLSFMSSSSL
jgi:hypothetical protein